MFVRDAARRRALIAALAAFAIALLAAPAARADLPYVAWSSVLPGWNDQYDPTSSNICVSGQPGCLQVTLNEQIKILNATGQACSHNALFPLAYVRMTQTYGWTRGQAGYYADVPYMNHMDAIFAKYYTDAYYNWASGNVAAVPGAWMSAFTSAANKTVTSGGDLLLGMNAHINRDLPYVLWKSGLVETDGVTSGKADYDKVEQWLYDDTPPLFSEMAQRFSPAIDDTNNNVYNWWAFQAVSAWRENAWRNAEALASAPDDASRALVAQSIENYANGVASTLKTTFAVTPLTESNATRDAYCALHKGDTAPVAYPMGTPTPWDNKIN